MKKLQILGPGCIRCRMLAENAATAADKLGIEYEIEKITNINDIIGFGVMLTPALVVDGEVKAAGKVPSADEIKEMLA